MREPEWSVEVGDCRDLLRAMPADSVQCAVTSPPYFGLRDYGLPPSVWGGDPDCDHEWIVTTTRGEMRRGLGLASSPASMIAHWHDYEERRRALEGQEGG